MVPSHSWSCAGFLGTHTANRWNPFGPGRHRCRRGHCDRVFRHALNRLDPARHHHVFVASGLVRLFLAVATHSAGRRFFLNPPGPDTTFDSQPSLQSLQNLLGRHGIATSHLRPSGVAEFDGKRIDCISEGMMVAPGTSVRCIRVAGGKVFVRPTDSAPAPLEAPPLTQDLEFDIYKD